jgi:hypothetical protein
MYVTLLPVAPTRTATQLSHHFLADMGADLNVVFESCTTLGACAAEISVARKCHSEDSFSFFQNLNDLAV